MWTPKLRNFAPSTCGPQRAKPIWSSWICCVVALGLIVVRTGFVACVGSDIARRDVLRGCTVSWPVKERQKTCQLWLGAARLQPFQMGRLHGYSGYPPLGQLS